MSNRALDKTQKWKDLSCKTEEACHRKFKMVAATNGLSMVDLLKQCLDAWIRWQDRLCITGLPGESAAVASVGGRNDDYRPEEPTHESNRLGVLIDAENVPAKIIGNVFRDLARFGEPIVRRAYGDFHGRLGVGWDEVLARHAIMPRHQASFGKGKNAADIALVVDAMDLLHGGRLDAFVIVSGDSDLAPLAMRIREEGLGCYIYGNQQTTARLRNASTRFVFLENLKLDPLSAKANPNMKPLRPKSDALPIIRTIITDLASAPGDWVEIDVLERELVRRAVDFDPRSCGHTRLLDLLVALQRPIIVDRSQGVAPRVRLRTKKPRTKIPQPTALDPHSTPAIVDNRATTGETMLGNGG